LKLEELQEKIRHAAANSRPLRICGGGSKDFYGGALEGELLDCRGHAGVVSYEPTELVVTARCGTRLADLEKTLAEKNQFLPFEPPHFGPGATLGGCIAAGLSGPRRAAAGAVRDFVLGVRLLDGRGQELVFGGQVMKNVAGYDVSRLVTGSLGTLGLILEASLKVLPRPAAEQTLALRMPEAQALEQMNRWAGTALPVTATAWRDGELWARVSGSAGGVRAAVAQIKGESRDAAFWQGIREQTDVYFAGPEPLWRLSLPSTAAPIGLTGKQLIEWGGALRWYRGSADAVAVREVAARLGGHATLFRGASKPGGAFAPLSPVLARLHRDLKRAFDPAGILNRGRLYPEL
jgi:glycolate oxidase FAD binding subunit